MITKELVRNLGIALACVFLTTLLLLANFLGSVMVLLCVAITLVSPIVFFTDLIFTMTPHPQVDLCGYMHFWGLTIDVVSAVNVIIAIGLCVDYSVHICHAFLTVAGARRERALAAMVEMGPAVGASVLQNPPEPSCPSFYSLLLLLYPPPFSFSIKQTLKYRDF